MISPKISPLWTSHPQEVEYQYNALGQTLTKFIAKINYREWWVGKQTSTPTFCLILTQISDKHCHQGKYSQQ